MVVNPDAAAHFIEEYKRFLGEVERLTDSAQDAPLLDRLTIARNAAGEDQGLRERALASLEDCGRALASDVLASVKSLRFERWIFLKDTRAYSVFVQLDGAQAYGVLGLTQPVRHIVGQSGVVMTTGVVEYQGRYVCDGLIGGSLVWLGPGYKRNLNARLAELRKSGEFRVACRDLAEAAGSRQ